MESGLTFKMLKDLLTLQLVLLLLENSINTFIDIGLNYCYYTATAVPFHCKKLSSIITSHPVFSNHLVPSFLLRTGQTWVRVIWAAVNPFNRVHSVRDGNEDSSWSKWTRKGMVIGRKNPREKKEVKNNSPSKVSAERARSWLPCLHCTVYHLHMFWRMLASLPF